MTQSRNEHVPATSSELLVTRGWGAQNGGVVHSNRLGSGVHSPPQADRSQGSVLAVDRLNVSLRRQDQTNARLLHEISFDVGANEALGIVGETGSGKSMTAKAILGLLRAPLTVESGSIRLGGDELLGKSDSELDEIRGRRIGVVFQNPKTSLHPMLRVETQIANVYRAHVEASGRETRKRVLTMLDRVRIGYPERVAKQYPHELSGGMAQRVTIAMALICSPGLVILDEPTTGLDVTIQREILEDLRKVLNESQTGLILITHDLGVVAHLCQRVVVMYGGRMMETGPTEVILTAPRHPYTMGLLIASDLAVRESNEGLALKGAPFDLADPPSGCVLHSRCPFAFDDCMVREPGLVELQRGGGNGHKARCLIAERL